VSASGGLLLHSLASKHTKGAGSLNCCLNCCLLSFCLSRRCSLLSVCLPRHHQHWHLGHSVARGHRPQRYRRGGRVARACVHVCVGGLYVSSVGPCARGRVSVSNPLPACLRAYYHHHHHNVHIPPGISRLTPVKRGEEANAVRREPHQKVLVYSHSAACMHGYTPKLTPAMVRRKGVSSKACSAAKRSSLGSTAQARAPSKVSAK
jgi:hypothetical protein